MLLAPRLVSGTSVNLYDVCMSKGKKLTASGVGMLALPEFSMVAKHNFRLCGVFLEDLHYSLYCGTREH
jgi:hypothetical protein